MTDYCSAVKSPNSRTRLNITASQYKSLLETIHAFAEATELIESFTVDATDFYVGRGSISFGPATLLDAVSEESTIFALAIHRADRFSDIGSPS
jgi:hypothetical protein